MSISISMHRCKAFRVAHHYPNNGNSLSLVVEGKDGEIQLTLYGLHEAVTERLLHEFSDDNTIIDHECGRTQPEIL